jgi:pullulanase
VDNSYQSTDFVNSIKWDREDTYQEVYQYYKGLIAFRKAHAALRMTKTSDIQAGLNFLDGLASNVVGYTINNSPNGESAQSLCIIFNANKEAAKVTIPTGNWNVYVKGNKAGTEILETISGGEITVEPISTLVLAMEDTAAKSTSDATVSEETDSEPAEDASAPAAAEAKNNKLIWYAALGVGVVALLTAAVIVIAAKRRKLHRSKLTEKPF